MTAGTLGYNVSNQTTGETEEDTDTPDVEANYSHGQKYGGEAKRFMKHMCQNQPDHTKAADA